MKILYIIPYVPQCGSSGPQGPKNFSGPLIKELTKAVSLDLIILGYGADKMHAENFVDQLPHLNNYRWFEVASGIRRSANRILSLVKGYPATVGEYYNKSLYDYLASLKNEYDVVHFDYFFVAPYAAVLDRSIPSLIVCHDAYSLASKRAFLHNDKLRYKLSRGLRWALFNNFEAKAYKPLTIVNTVSPVDSEVLRLNGVRNVHVIPIGISKEYLENTCVQPERNQKPSLLIVVPLMGWERCEAVWFMREGLKKLEQACGPLNITVFGRGANDFEKYCPLDIVSTVAYVEYVTNYCEFLGSGWVYLYLLRVGSGLHTKLLDAMSMGIPVVGYSDIMNSFVGRNGIDYISCDSRPEIVDSVIKLFGDGELRKNMGEFAREMVLNHYTVESLIDSLMAQYRSLLSNGK